MRKYPKYKKNLHTVGNEIYSYKTFVAEYIPEKGVIYAPKFWSITTSKHINYVASIWGFTVVDKI